MESSILNSIGIDPGIIVIVMMGIMIFVLLYMVRVSMKMTRFMKRYRIFMKGKDAVSLEKAFAQRFPRLQKKTECVENLLPVELIYKQAADTSEYMDFLNQNLSEQSEKTWVLLSIGRFCKAKNFESIPELCRRIQEQGIQIIWYLIGYGSDEMLIRQKIREQHVEKSVILLGKKVNPYPYLAACDWYVQPSRYEGKSVAVREAQALHKPVIITEYPTAESQLVNGYDGVIVPLETKACSQAMAEILQDDRLREMLIANTRKQSYAGMEEIKKIYHWMDTDR